MIDLDAVDGVLEHTSPGPWHVGDIWVHAATRARGDTCAACEVLGAPAWVGVCDINGVPMMAHRHRAPSTDDGAVSSGSGFLVARDMDADDARFVAAARTLVPELVAEVRRLRAAAGDDA